MRVAVITPYAGEGLETVMRCVRSVASQVGVECLHVIVCDGCEPDARLVQDTIVLPARTNDAGATPRAIGSVYALRLLPDAIAFLDVDNEWHPDHLRSLLASDPSKPIVTSRRVICHAETGEPLCADSADSDGIKFADTNTILLRGPAMQFARMWGWSGTPNGADRVFWDQLRRSFGEQAIAHTGLETCFYRSTWAAHYQGHPNPPARLKGLERQPDGSQRVRWL
jgi:glycosyltransferase involved in cell wall biosynthesis